MFEMTRCFARGGWNHPSMLFSWYEYVQSRKQVQISPCK